MMWAMLKVDRDPNNITNLQSSIPEKSSADRALLGKGVMEAIWEDMSFTQLPSWVGSVPCNWGMTKRGKLSADNWRVIITIHLTITLIWLWGRDNRHKKELLDNFMDLVCAVCIANMRVSESDFFKKSTRGHQD